MAKITEGYMPFHGYQTYYRIVGEQKDNGKAPLICLHGGPGSTHNYYEAITLPFASVILSTTWGVTR